MKMLWMASMRDIEKKRHWLATKAMGWIDDIAKNSMRVGGRYYDMSKEEGIQIVLETGEWRPDQDITQAIGLLKDFKEIKMTREPKLKWGCYIGVWSFEDMNSYTYYAEENELSEAIFEAVLQAIGYYKENKND